VAAVTTVARWSFLVAASCGATTSSHMTVSVDKLQISNHLFRNTNKTACTLLHGFALSADHLKRQTIGAVTEKAIDHAGETIWLQSFCINSAAI